MGVPSFEVSAGGKDYDLMYHSTYEVQSELDWDYMASIDKFFFRLFKSMDAGALPYDFAARGADLAADRRRRRARRPPAWTQSAADKLADQAAQLARKGSGAGATPHRYVKRSAADRGQRAVAARRQAARSRATRRSTRGTTPATRTSRRCGTSSTWTRPSPSCRPTPWTPRARLEDLINVGVNWYATLFTPSVVNYDLTRHDPDYYRVTWGALGKQINHFDMAPVWALIEAGQYDKAIAKLQKMRAADVTDLRSRVDGMIDTTSDVIFKLDQLRRLPVGLPR